ncbi:MAG: hypothetical protein OK438_00560 [Thaumarchaeota archaeon]|nr:hypothetical protein [Nitrososphaerota archaeon]
MRASRKRKGVAGIFVALILFAVIFTAGANYFLFVNQATLGTNQANVIRQDALLQERQENLALNVVLWGASTLVLSAVNTGGSPTSISSIYLVDGTGKTINPGPVGTNISASYWPLSLNVGASTNRNSACIAGMSGCNIALTGYSYTSGTVLVKVLTGRGNVFSARFPPQISGGVGSDAIVVTMVATPTPPLTEVFTCTGCVTLTVTAYNFASSSVIGAFLSPAVPFVGRSGTASLSGGSCGAPFPSSTISAYSGSGNAPSITFTCTYNAQTGAVGGFASLSGYVQGTLNGIITSSSEAVSNNIQIGANANVPTQGAFSANFFFSKFSSCQNGPSGSIGSYTYSSACTTAVTMPPSNPASLPSAATVSAGGNYYVAFYAQITNNYPSTLAVLQYTFLQLDSSHPPPNVGNETDFWLVGAASTYNAQLSYYPSYCNGGGCGGNKLPTLAPYAGNEVTCAETGPLWTPSTNCIDIAYEQTVTLALAACGFGTTYWDWGGSQYANHFDHSNGCTSSAPGFSSSGAANVLTLVICYLYQGQMYTQAIQFQGIAVTP